MKKSLLLIIAVFCFCLLTAAAAFADNVVLIGIYEPASGDSGAGGKQEMLGVQYANYLTPTVEIGGETYDIQLIYADNGSSFLRFRRFDRRVEILCGCQYRSDHRVLHQPAGDRRE